MNKKLQRIAQCLALLSTTITGVANAHLLPAQQGTLNVTDNGVYMVLSLPSSAFTFADDNFDGSLSTEEFITHWLDIINSVREDVVMLGASEDFPDYTEHTIEGVMLTPVYDHSTESHTDASHTKPDLSEVSPASVPIDQIIVMGRFLPHYINDKLQLQLELFGNEPKEQSFTITTKFTARRIENEFKLTSSESRATLFAQPDDGSSIFNQIMRSLNRI